MPLYDPIFDSEIFSTGVFDTTPLVGTVSFPFMPDRIIHQKSVAVNSLEVDGALSILYATRYNATKLTLEGRIYGAGSTAADLRTTWVTPIENLIGSFCVLVLPAARFNGTWLCIKTDFEEIADGGDAKYDYSIEYYYKILQSE